MRVIRQRGASLETHVDVIELLGIILLPRTMEHWNSPVAAGPTTCRGLRGRPYWGTLPGCWWPIPSTTRTYPHSYYFFCTGKRKASISSLVRKCHASLRRPTSVTRAAWTRIPWECAREPFILHELWFLCSLTMSQFGLGIASYELVFSGKRDPFGHLFVWAQDRNASHEDPVEEKCYISWKRPGEKAQVVFLHWWSSRDVINEAVTWWQ